eukprot:11594543-Heterocapsa_arctica.AAC.1
MSRECVCSSSYRYREYDFPIKQTIARTLLSLPDQHTIAYHQGIEYSIFLELESSWELPRQFANRDHILA